MAPDVWESHTTKATMVAHNCLGKETHAANNNFAAHADARPKTIIFPWSHMSASERAVLVAEQCIHAHHESVLMYGHSSELIKQTNGHLSELIKTKYKLIKQKCQNLPDCKSADPEMGTCRPCADSIDKSQHVYCAKTSSHSLESFAS